MITFQRQQGGLYLTEAGAADPSTARVGFLFQDAGRADPTFELTPTSWKDRNQLGYFAFFAPSATRDWAAFAGKVRDLFAANQGAQFGWFAESEAGVSPATLIQVADQGTPNPFVLSSFAFNFAGNVTLVMQATPFDLVTISFGDGGSNDFRFVNASGIRLGATAPDQGTVEFSSTSAFLALPMNDAPAQSGGSAHAGSVNAAFELAATGLAAFEAGFMYFGPPQTGVLTALRYPAFVSPHGEQAVMGFNGWFDVLGPLDGMRSYLQFTDPAVRSYFTTSRGAAVTLGTTNGNVATTSRLVFANRPRREPTDTGTVYLTPAGAFSLAGDGGGPRGNLLCGTTGTEFLDVGLGGATPDTLLLQPGQPAFQKTTPATGVDAGATYLDSVNGNVTTSWVQLVTTGGSYVSQPQESPLYEQGSAQAALLDGAGPASGLSVYLLDFLPLPTWHPAGTAPAAAQAAPAQAPPVPMVPFAGLQFASPDQAAPFRAMETAALNPTRKNAFSAAQQRLNAAARQAGLLAALDAPAGDPVRWAMTPQGLLAGLDAQNSWTATQMAISPNLAGTGSDTLQFTAMGEQVRQALQQNQTFLVVSTLTNPATTPQELFRFAGADQTLNIAGWPFSLSPAGTPATDGTPPILILKFYPGQSIAELVDDVSLWSQPYVFNAAFTPQQAQAYLRKVIREACESVYGKGKCPGGTPLGQPDTTSLYYNFYQVVTDPGFSGVLALNANMQLNNLPTAIRAVTGGMTVPGEDGTPVSTIDQFRVHHVGVSINDTSPTATTPTLAQSSLFGLVDYEKPASPPRSAGDGALPGVGYNFQVEYLRALFTNSELTRFSSLINLTIHDLFGTPVTLEDPAGEPNVVKITGSYQAHSTSGDDSTSGEGVYSFVAEGDFAFTFGHNPYLDTITLTKLQFSFLQETPAGSGSNGGHTSTIQASFGIWGKMVFKEFDVLDVFSFQQLAFNDLGIAVRFDLTTYPATVPPAPPAPSPHTGNLSLSFSPGNLRVDAAESPARQGSTSMLRLLPFKLTSFFYNQFPDRQTLEDLQYIPLAHVDLGDGITLTDRFNYGFAFELDLGSWGALAGPLQAFRFSFLVGWLTDTGGGPGKIAFGVQLPEANGKLEITIQGVLQLVIQQFKLQYQTATDGTTMLVLVLYHSYIQVLGQRLPPGDDQFFDFALFAPVDDASRIGWIAAISTGEEKEGGEGAEVVQALPANWRVFPEGIHRPGALPSTEPGEASGDPSGAPAAEPFATSGTASGSAASEPAPAETAVAELGTREEAGTAVTVPLPPHGWAPLTDRVSGRTLHGRGGGRAAPAGGGEKAPVFQLVYLGLGQRTGPDPKNPPTTFESFLSFMQTDFWEAVSNNEYDKVYHPDGQWLAITDFKLLGVIEVGFIFYDVTPFYSLTLSVQKLFSFEITYTRISDTIGLFYATLALPPNLRTFQVGAASLTLPSLAVSVYTNGDWKVDVGFPSGDDWSRSFRVQAQAGPVPVTGSGGFYIARLSSATTDVFKGDYPSIVAFGFAARLGVGKDFVSGPLKAGVSVTFFGIIQGAAGYLSSGSTDIFRTPDALQLQGQFGIIGELYGSINFVIVKASVNVRLQASIGVVLSYERSIPNSGSILLYIEASVKVSVKVEIDVGFFSVTISFSFKASFRFEWQLLGSGSSPALLDARRGMFTRSLALASTGEIPVLPLLPGLTSNLALWYLPEGTVVFPAATGTGTPWLVNTLGIPYDPSDHAAPPPYAQFKPFEAATAQLVTWAVGHALMREGGSYTVTRLEIAELDQEPETLVGWVDYPTLLRQLAVFSTTTLALPPEGEHGTGHASTFPMPPFLKLVTTGRLDAAGKVDEMDYVFASKNPVSPDYIARVDAYFNQLFVNQQNAEAGQLTATLFTEGKVPLGQEIFLNYFTGLVRGGVHAVLQTMQDRGMDEGRIDALIQEAAGAGQFKPLAGQMSSSFRGGARLPYTEGLTVPGGEALETTNPLFALLWQEFPVGSLGSAGAYTVSLFNADPAAPNQGWVTGRADWKLTADWLKPFAEAKATDVAPPSAPVQLPFTDVGPQAFAFQNAVEWTQPDGATPTLFPFPGNLAQLQGVETGDLEVLVQSRATGGAYLPGGTALPPGDFTWATQITLTAAQIPGAGGEPLGEVFALSGASQRDQRLIEQILDAGTGRIAALQLLYQSSADSSGLGSDLVDDAQVFVLRTNTTTVSAPPTELRSNSAFFEEEPEPAGVPVGAALSARAGFLQIVQQAAVTNAPGYYLRYLNRDGKSLPPALFAGGPAPLTLLVTWQADGTQNTPASPARVAPYFNAIVIRGVDDARLYYAETTDPALNTQYASVAAGSVGVLLTQRESDALMQPHPSVAAMCRGANAGSPRGWRRSELVAALVDAGVSEVAEVRDALAASGSGASQLNALYSLITYQVQATAGFRESNLSAPVQPQQPDAGSSAADGLLLAEGDEGDVSSFRVYVPLYAVATPQNPPPRPPNRYASIGQPVEIDFYQNDAFGNQMPGEHGFASTNLYFDAIVPVDEWQGVVTAYDFAGGAAGTVNVHLRPGEAAFAELEKDPAQASLQAYYTIQDQLTGPGVTLAVETNLALQRDGSMAHVTLGTEQTGKVLEMVAGIVTYLEALVRFLEGGTGPRPPFTVKPVALAVAVSGPGVQPPVFELQVLLGIERDPALISPLLVSDGVVTFPSAQHRFSSVVPTVGSDDAGEQVPVTTFAAGFVKSFPAFVLSVGLGGAQEVEPAPSTARSRRRALRAAGVAGDGSSGTAPAQAQSLWAVNAALVRVQVGEEAGTGPFYLSPTPLDNTLNTAMVPLPPLPRDLVPADWPAQQLFTDVDLDQLNTAFFAAVDGFLAPASAAQAFEAANPAYTTVATGRRSLADLYAANEVDWLFAEGAPFTGTGTQRTEGREAFGQQMRAALGTAYAVDTVVQYGVQWAETLPPGVDDLYSLFGTVRPIGGAELPRGFTISASQVAVNPAGPGLLTFLFGVGDVRATAAVSLGLEFNVTHVQHFLEPKDAGESDEARPSIWLQLVDPYPQGAPVLGSGTTEIPLVFRQYPTPPTLVSQSATAGTSSGALPGTSRNPITAAAAWYLQYRYQAQLTAHDQLASRVTYNTNLSAGSGGGGDLNAKLLGNVETVYTLFQALARFSATWPVLMPVLARLDDPRWADAAGVFAMLVNDVVRNTTWTPLPGANRLLASLPDVTDPYTVTDRLRESGQRLITLTWPQHESSFKGATLSILAVDPAGVPYPNQVPGTVPNGITRLYNPEPPLVNDQVSHRVEVDGLNVLAAENALAGVQVERNVIRMESGGTAYLAQDEFVYRTPLVRATQPVTPFVDNPDPINVAELPEAPGAGCPTTPTPPGIPGLCRRIYTLMYALLAGAPAETLVAARALARAGMGAEAEADESAPRRVKISCGFQYPVKSAGGVVSANPVSPLVPVSLARSFVIDGTSTEQLGEFSGLFATAIAQWAEGNQVTLGPGAQEGTRFVFDATLYAQISGLNVPVLRLRTLWLALADIPA